MNCIFPFNITIKNIIDTYNQYSTNNLFDKKYMIKKVFKELLFFLQVDMDQQREEIAKCVKNKSILDWLKKEIIVLYGSLLEQEMANVFINYQLSPEFINTTGNIINMHNRQKMEQFDILVRSLRDNSLCGFDVKHGTVFRKASNDMLYIYNSALSSTAFNKIFNNYRIKAERDYKQSISAYILFVCYDMLTQYNFNNQAELYKKIFNIVPNHVEKVCFVIDIQKLFKIVQDEFNNTNIRIFNKKSPYILSLYEATGKEYYIDKYAININSDICMNLFDFINLKLIL